MEINTAEGVVRGVAGRHVNRWRGIPFAAPPVGELRLRAPQPVTPWTGVRDTIEFGNASIQPRFGAQIGIRRYQPTGEDCLTLNVTAPAEPATTPRPVMVFIHGGAYVIGTTALDLYSGGRLATRGDVVYVSVNYRLGAFGYLDFSRFGTSRRPFDSNLGLRDQVAALEWVQRNIAAFGGDPGNVTIFGESAGGASVTTLLATPAAKGLFHRVIAESAPVDWTLDPDVAAATARAVVDRLGLDPADAATALATIDPDELRRGAAKAVVALLRERPGMPATAPVVDGDYLPKRPLDAMRDGSAHRVPLIIGTNRNEGTLFARMAEGLPTDNARQALLFADVDPRVAARLIGAYGSYTDGPAAVKLGGDHAFWRPTIEACEAHGAHVPTYNYRYDFAPRALNRLGYGATHASELIAVFGYGDSTFGRAITVPGGRRDLRTVTEQVQDQWITFARTGSPLPSWPAYTTERRATMVFDTHTRVVDDLDQRRRTAWAAYRDAVHPPVAAADSAVIVANPESTRR